MPKNRIKPEYKKKLLNGIVLYINQIGDMYGSKCFLITDTTGIYDSFVITADCSPLKGEVLTEAQQRIIPQIKKTIEEIIAGQIEA